MTRRKLDLFIGDRLHPESKLAYVSEHFPKDSGNRKYRAALFRCDCGGTCVKRVTDVRQGRTKSCSCGYTKYPQNVKDSKVDSLHEYYQTWYNMISRIFNPKNTFYEHYGGRGLTVCDKWIGDGGFRNFVDDMGPCPDGYTLDRINTDRGYFPNNCQWSGRTHQNFNRRRMKSNSSGQTGVCWKKKNKKWEVQIRKEGNIYYLGLFDTFEDAVKARKDAEVKHYGFKLKY